ncbi:hypothetical protein ACO2Q3_12160 [Caulobacter sp. KR2-114]
MQLETQIRVGEAARAGTMVARRWGGGGAAAILVSLCVAVVGMSAANMAVRAAGAGLGLSHDHLNLAALIGSLVVGLGVALPISTRILRAVAKWRMARGGVVGPFPARYELTDDAFIYTLGEITRTVPWRVTSELLLARGWWVLMAQAEPLYLPRRAFADPAAEQAFVGEILRRLPPAARARSARAMAALGAPTR